MKKHIPKIIFGIFFICFIISFFIFRLYSFLSLKNILMIKDNVLKLNYFGPILIIFIFFILSLVYFPIMTLIPVCGFLFGPVKGSIIAWIGMMFGIIISFINSRYLFRKDFLQKFGDSKPFKKIELYTSKYKGWAVIFFRVFFIIPYNIQNPCYALTSIKLNIFVIGSAIGILPVTILYSYLGSLLANNKIEISTFKFIPIILGSIFLLIISVIIISKLFLKKRLNMSKE